MDSKPCVLIVDDCEDMLAIEKIFIERHCDSRAITAKSFDELKSLGDKMLKCKLAFLDINFGEGQPSGLEIYRWLRENGFSQPIFFLTGHAQNSELVREAHKLGQGALLTKPIVPALFTKLIQDPTHELARHS